MNHITTKKPTVLRALLLILQNACWRIFHEKKTIVTGAFGRKPEPEELHVASVRVGSVPGTHTLIFDSAADTIELTHTARSREGFAIGAVRALEWLSAPDAGMQAKKGVFTMNDVFAAL